MKPINPYPLRLEEDVMEELKIMAEDHSRSVNKEIEFIVKLALKEYKEENEEKDKSD